MGEFVEESDSLKHSLSFLELETNLEQLSKLTKLNGSVVENPWIGLMSYYNDHSMPQHPEFSMSDIDIFSSFWPDECQIPVLVPKIDAESNGQQSHGGRKRKTIMATNTNYGDNSGLHSEVEQAGVEIKKKNLQHTRDSKRGKSNSKELEKPIEVVHVRARRGQATDRHSLAERERRKKINERMRRLQDHVPGCYKAMGTARMLDEIISYVQSLQNQVEFLSMQLSVAKYFKDYNLRAEPLGTAQADKAAHEVREEEKQMWEGYGNSSSLYSSVPL